MKLLTLNLHCFAEENIHQIQQHIVETIIEKDIDICFFQEVAQQFDHPIINNRIKEGNYAYTLQQLLREKGFDYDLHYDFSKRGFALYDEGLAILSKTPLHHQTSYHVSNKVDYFDWHTRMNVSCETWINDEEVTLTSVHFGWTEGDEVFEDQVDRSLTHLDFSTWNIIAGDFNVSENSKEYAYLLEKGLYDLYYNGDEQYRHDVTHRDYIDVKQEANRIDYLFSNKPCKTIQREILFTDHRVSDHYGVFIEIEVEK